MSIACAPDICQSIMIDLLGDLDYVLVYIDNILLLQRHGETAEDHLKKMEVVLKRLNDVGFQTNLCKSFFMQTEVDYLGFLLTSEGIRPQPKKIEAMTRVKPPTNSKQLKQFLGMVNFYRDMWPRRSHCLAPLAKLSSKTGKMNWLWEKVHQQALDKEKQYYANMQH